jgi:hypothetical protein
VRVLLQSSKVLALNCKDAQQLLQHPESNQAADDLGPESESVAGL